MFNFLGNSLYDDVCKNPNSIHKMSDIRYNPQNEFFRVGVTTDGMTTITIMTTDGFSSTLSLNQCACEQLIRMLRATYNNEQTTETSE